MSDAQEATRPMISPDGRTFNIPLSMVEGAKQDGLVSAQAMKDEQGKTRYVPMGKEKDAFAQGMTNRDFPPQPSTKEELSKPMETRTLIQSLMDNLGRGGPDDMLANLPALGGIAPGISTPVSGARSLGGRLSLESPPGVLDTLKLGAPPVLQQFIKNLPAGEFAAESTLPGAGGANIVTNALANGGASALNMVGAGAKATGQGAVSAAMLAKNFAVNHPWIAAGATGIPISAYLLARMLLGGQ